MTLGGTLSKLAFLEKMSVTITVTYVGPDDSTTAEATVPRPITLHAWPFSDPDFLVLYREQGKSEPWEEIEREDGCMGFRLVDNPPIRTTAGAHKDFFSLTPGESWSMTHDVHRGHWSYTDLPRDVRPGERFRYSFRETRIDWWAWGAKEEHMETEILLPDWINGPVLDEEGKPRKRKEGDPPEIFVGEADSDEFVFTG